MEYSDYIETRNPASALTGDEKFAFSQGGAAVEDDLNAFAAFINDLIDRYTFPFPQFDTATSTTAYTGTPSPAITAYATGQKFQVKAHATSTGAATLALNGLAAKKVFINPATQATTGDVVVNQVYLLVYDTALDGGSGGFLMMGSGGGVVPVKASAAELIANSDDAKFATALALRGKLAANDTETGSFNVAQTDDQKVIFVNSASAAVATFPVLTADTYVTLVNIGDGDVSWAASGTTFDGPVSSLPGGTIGSATFFYKSTTDIKVIAPPTNEALSILIHDTTQTGNTGTGEDTLFSYALPASQLANNGNAISGRASGTFATSANNKRLRFKFGATTILDTTSVAITSAASWVLTFEIVRTGATTQKCNATLITSSSVLVATAAYTTAAETLSGAVTILVTGEGTSDNDIVGQMFKVTFEP